MKTLILLCTTYITLPRNEAAHIPLIIKGENAIEGQFPWHATLYIPPGERYICGGSLITPSHILSAAHCLVIADEFIVALGSIKRSDYLVKYHTTNFAIHEEYDNARYANDIGILTLPQPVTMSEKISLISLPRKVDGDLSELFATAIGFGFTETGRVSEDLKFTSVVIVDNGHCGNRTPNFMVDTQLCTVGSPVPQGTCFGDSGGSLVIDQNSENVIVGICSYTKRVNNTCLNSYDYPSYFTRVHAYLPWINERISS